MIIPARELFCGTVCYGLHCGSIVALIYSMVLFVVLYKVVLTFESVG